jgi:thymidylate synthase (FAD)
VTDPASDPTSEAPDPGEAAIRFRSDMTVELVKATAHDSDVVFAARVSTAGEQSLADVDTDGTRNKGLIGFLMRERHGCYDQATDVLTASGWKSWPDVTGDEEFVTLSVTGEIELQRAERVISYPVDGPMVRVRMAQLDLLVTPEHRMLAQRRRQPGRQAWELVPATDLFDACHRIRTGGGRWSGRPGRTGAKQYPPGFLALLGFFIGDGHLSARGGTPSFRLHKSREVLFLHQQADRAGYWLTGTGDRFHLRADDEFRLLAKRCYDDDRAKVIPGELFDEPVESLRELLGGLMHSDGSVSPSGKQTYHTTSRVLADQVQALALLCGRSATVAEHPFTPGDGHLGKKTHYRVTLYRPRSMTPRVGWTTRARGDQVSLEDYRGTVYCVSVPNGTLYVRRNGKPAWSGNSPFEHNSMTFYVQAPIFVFREFMRHRIASYNEESGRYRQLDPVFYVPGPDRHLVQQGKPGAYEFVEGTREQYDTVVEQTRTACTDAYRAYLRMLDAGVAREVARGVLPVATYSSMYVTLNARSLMNFLSLRTKREGSHFPSYPQREIEMVAELMEAEWARLMPVTHAAFEAAGRVSP